MALQQSNHGIYGSFRVSSSLASPKRQSKENISRRLVIAPKLAKSFPVRCAWKEALVL